MLDETLRKVRQAVEGAEVAVLIDKDGMIVAVDGDEPALELIAASYMDLVRKAGQAHREADREEPQEILAVGPSGSMLIRAVTADYAVMLLLSPEGLPGRARFELRKACAGLRPELEG